MKRNILYLILVLLVVVSGVRSQQSGKNDLVAGNPFSDSSIKMQKHNGDDFQVVYHYNKDSALILGPEHAKVPHYKALIKVYRMKNGKRSEESPLYAGTYVNGLCGEDDPHSYIIYFWEVQKQTIIKL